MSHVPELSIDRLDAQQRRIHDEMVNSPRGGVVGPFTIWLRVPEIADATNQLFNAFRLHARMERRLFELMVLVVAHHCSAEYEWLAHEPHALRAGLVPEVVEAIRLGTPPSFTRDDERLVFDIVTELNGSRTLSRHSFEQGLAGLGLEPLIELIAGVGFYTMAALTLNAFDVSPPNGQQRLT